MKHLEIVYVSIHHKLTQFHFNLYKFMILTVLLPLASKLCQHLVLFVDLEWLISEYFLLDVSNVKIMILTTKLIIITIKL